MSEDCRKFRRQLFDMIIDALQARALTKFWRATPGWDTKQGTLSMIAPGHAKPPKPESINVPLSGCHRGRQEDENVVPSVVHQLVKVRLDQHVEGQSHRLWAYWVLSIENLPPSHTTARAWSYWLAGSMRILVVETIPYTRWFELF